MCFRGSALGTAVGRARSVSPGNSRARNGGKPQTGLALVRTAEGWPGGQPRTRGSAPLWLGFSTVPLQSSPTLRREEGIVGQNRRGERSKEGMVIHSGKPQTELELVRTSEGWPGGQPRTRGSAPLWLEVSTVALQSLPRLRREEWLAAQNRRGARREDGIVTHNCDSLSHNLMAGDLFWRIREPPLACI